MAGPRAATTVQKTRNFDFLFGRYSHSNCTIPYFQISMTFTDAARYLRLVNEMPGSAGMNWKIEELFQRDIDWPRVERKIVPYLKNQTQPQFFNSLTIALLPIRNDSLGTFSGDEPWHCPTLDGEEQFSAGTIQPFGPITCGYWGEWNDPSDDNARLGQLCWNTDETCGVAIDGQHRLAAIKHLVGPGSDVYRRSSVPVILIVLDSRLGFNGGESQQALVDTLRRLFIDLNKHAETVKRARHILLDDRDPASICVRTLVGEQLRTGRDELADDNPVLPLSLIDWHSEQAKFDGGPYLTTILGLDWTVAKTLAIDPFEDPMAHERTARLIDRLERKLNIELSPARERLKDCRRYDRPFGFVDDGQNDELDQISTAFSSRWTGPLIHLLTCLSPYEALIELRDQLGTLQPEFANWYALKESADDAGGGGKASDLLNDIERFLENRDDDPIAISDFRDALKSCDDLKSDRKLAFTVVFQRAMIFAFLQLTTVKSAMVESLASSSEFELDDMLDEEEADEEWEQDIEPDEQALDAHEKERAEDLVSALNHIVAQDVNFLDIDCQFTWHDDASKFDRFWLCSLARPEGPIDFTQGASRRASDILLLIGLFWLYREHEGLSDDDFDDLMERAEEATTGIDLKLKQCLNRMWSSHQSIAGRILNSREQDVEDDDARWQEVYGRTAWLWNLMHQ